METAVNERKIGTKHYFCYLMIMQLWTFDVLYEVIISSLEHVHGSSSIAT